MPHIHEKIDFTVDVYVVHNRKVLIRLHEKYNRWLSVGGHVELDESPDAAAIREVKEEVGLDIQLVHPKEIPQFEEEYKGLGTPWYMNIHSINDIHQHLSLVYFAKAETDVVVPERDTDQWKWFTSDELNSSELVIGPTVKFYAQEALRVIQ